MTSRSRGEGVTQSMTNSTDRLRECVTGGVQNPKKFCGRHLSIALDSRLLDLESLFCGDWRVPSIHAAIALHRGFFLESGKGGNAKFPEKMKSYLPKCVHIC